MPFPARPDSATLGRHERLAREFAGYLARGDGRAAGDWLRRLAREPGISPWLLIDQRASRTATQMTPAHDSAPPAAQRRGAATARTRPTRGPRPPPAAQAAQTPAAHPAPRSQAGHERGGESAATGPSAASQEPQNGYRGGLEVTAGRRAAGGA